MKKHGEVIREIRKSKGMSLEVAGGKAVPISTLSDFETGKTNLNVPDFFEVFSNLWITMSEFSYVQNNYQDRNHTKVWIEGERLYSEGKKAEFEILLFAEETKWATGSLKEQVYFLAFKSHFAGRFKSPELELTKQEQRKVYKYLSIVKSWGLAEISLFTNLANAFDVATLKELSDLLLTRATVYLSIYENKKAFIFAVITAIYVLLDLNELKFAIKLYNHIEALIDGLYSSYSLKIDFLFISGRLSYIQAGGVGKKAEKGKEQMLSVIDICKTLKSTSAIKTFQNDYDFLTTEWLETSPLSAVK